MPKFGSELIELKRKWAVLTALSTATALIVGGFFAKTVFAYTTFIGMSSIGNIVKFGDGSLGLEGGDRLHVVNNGPYPALLGQNLYAAYAHDEVYTPSGSLDGQGDWPYIQADVIGQSANNGYLLIGDPSTGSSNVDDWVTRLGGNVNYVKSYLESQDQITVQDQAESNKNIVFDAFAALITESGAKFGQTSVIDTGQKDAQGNEIMKMTRPIYESAPPTATSIGVEDGTTYAPGTVTQGDPINFTLSSNIHLWSGESTHHWDAVQLTNNSTGQSVWALGSSSTDFSGMYAVGNSAAAGYGSQTDSSLTGDIPAFSNTSSLQPGTYTATFWVADGVDRVSQPVTTTFTVTPAAPTGSGGGSSTPPPSSAPTITALPSTDTTLKSGASENISYQTTGWQSGDYVVIQHTQNGVIQDSWSNNNDTNSSDSYSETESPQYSSSVSITYQMSLYNQNGQVIAQTTTGQITWNENAPPTPSSSTTITVQPGQDVTVPAGMPVTVSYNVNGWSQGDVVREMPSGNGKNVWNIPWDSQNPSDSATETENPAPGQKITESYMFYVDNVTTNQWLNQATTGTITWENIPPTISMSASPSTTTSGNAINISYSTQYLTPSDYVVVSGSGGQNMWNTTNDTNSTDSYSEVEKPMNGDSTVVNYTATIYNNSGQALAQATVTATWTSSVPTITMNANPTTMVPGQSSTISYSVQNMYNGDYVQVSPSGNGSDMWNASNQTAAQETYTEVESPLSGGTTDVTYTGMVYNPNGQVIAQSTVSVKWINAWSGTINLSANPLYLPTGSNTTLTAKASQAIPSGYTLIIKDVSTGQVVQESSQQTLSAPYTSYSPETDDFVSYVSDGYENIGNNSNTVEVVWSELSLGANPTQLPSGQATTLTVSGQNVPGGDYLVILNQQTGQTVGYSQSTPYSVQVSEPTPQTDSFVACISSSSSVSGALINSNTVSVDWYGITLTATPTRLPVGDSSTLTASAANLPSGYVMDILNKMTGQVIATGQPGQTTLNVLQTRKQVETDQFVAQVVQPGNPPIPGLSVSQPTLWKEVATSPLDPNNPSQSGISSVVYYDGNLFASTWGDYVWEWNGTSWTSLGGNSGYVHSLFVYNGQLYADFYSAGTARWNGGNSWTTITSGVPSYYPGWYDGSSINGTLMLNNQIVENLAAWEWTGQPPYNGTWYAKGVFAFNGSSWTNIAPPFLNNDQTYQNGDYVIGGIYTLNNNLYTIGPNANGTSNILYKLQGNQWTPVQGAPSNLTSLAYYNNTIYAGGSTLYKLTGTTWTDIGGGNVPGRLVSLNGSLYTIGAGVKGVEQWNGSSWEQLSSTLDPSDSNTSTVSDLLYMNGNLYAISDGKLYEMIVPTTTYTTNVVVPEKEAYPQTQTLQGSYAPGGISFTAWDDVTGPNPTPASQFGGLSGNFYLKNNNTGQVYMGGTNGESVTVTGSDGNQYTIKSYLCVTNANNYSEYGITLEIDQIVAVPPPAPKMFPFWTFTNAPSYVPTSLFTSTSQISSDGNGAIWTTGSSSQSNGTAFFQGNFTLSQSQQVTISVPIVDDYAQVYVDGQPVLQTGTAGGVGGSIPNTSSATVTLPAGRHQVIIEASNNNEFASTNSNSAGVALNVTANGQTILTTSNPSAWTTTGYVTQLPAGWFSGAIGTWNWTEYVMQENASQPIYQQQAYTLTTSAQNVSATSAPVNVTWFNPVTPPDNFNLQALPTNVTVPGTTQFKVTFDQSDADFVNQAFNGTGNVVIRCVQTWQQVATGTWTPNTNGMSVSIPYTPVGGTSLQYVAFLVDPAKNVEVAVSNQVTVTDTGQGVSGSSYTTTTCGPNGDGTEIYNTYTNGKLTGSKTLPLTMKNLEIDGIYNPTAQLQSDLGLGAKIQMPITNAQIGNGPIPLRVQAPFAFAIQFPDAQPTSVTATLSVIERDAVDVNGDTSWTVKMHPATNLAYGFWQGETIMPKLPDGDHITIQITATNE